MIRDLLTPEAHHDPYVWSAVLLAHALIGVGLTGAALPLIGPAAAWIVSAAYLLLWEGSQLRTARQRGGCWIIAMLDGLADAVGVAMGCWMAVYLAVGEALHFVTALAALLIVAVAGYWRRV